jgi:hypothetical protein
MPRVRERSAGQERVDATIAAHGMTTPVRTNGVMRLRASEFCRPPPPVVQERRERAARTRRNKGMLSKRALTPARHKARSPSLVEPSPGGARPVCRTACGPRLPVRAKSLLIRAIRGDSAHRRAHERRVCFGEASNAETGFAPIIVENAAQPPSRSRRRGKEIGRRGRLGIVGTLPERASRPARQCEVSLFEHRLSA